MGVDPEEVADQLEVRITEDPAVTAEVAVLFVAGVGPLDDEVGDLMQRDPRLRRPVVGDVPGVGAGSAASGTPFDMV